MYIDIHHHLIHGMDDGARTFDETRRMLLAAQKDGISRIIATPHAEPGLQPFLRERYAGHLKMARDWCAARKMPIAIYEGCEILYTESAARLLREGAIPTLAGGQFVLVEFFPADPFKRIQAAVREIGNAGYIPILAHAERYACLGKVDRLLSLREKYQVRVQINAQSVLRRTRFLEKMQYYSFERQIQTIIGKGLCDYIATDAHNLQERRCRMRAAYAAIAQRYGAGIAHKLCRENALEVLPEA